MTEEYAYLILDARYERVREAGVIRSRAVLVAIGIDWEGRRKVLAVVLADRESTTSWRNFLLGLKQRGPSGVHLVVTDDHAGLKQAVAEVLPAAPWQRGYVHFLRNALDYLPRSADRACLQELRCLYDRRHANNVGTVIPASRAERRLRFPAAHVARDHRSPLFGTIPPPPRSLDWVHLESLSPPPSCDYHVAATLTIKQSRPSSLLAGLNARAGHGPPH